MFSDVGQSLDQDTVEYAWLVEIQLGKLSGRLTAPQLYTLVECLEILVLLSIDDENELNHPKDDVILYQPVVKKKMTHSQNVHVQHVQVRVVFKYRVFRRSPFHSLLYSIIKINPCVASRVSIEMYFLE